MTEHEVEAQLPLTPLSFEFLLALADGARHGYGVIKEIERQTRVQPAARVGCKPLEYDLGQVRRLPGRLWGPGRAPEGEILE